MKKVISTIVLIGFLSLKASAWADPLEFDAVTEGDHHFETTQVHYVTDRNVTGNRLPAKFFGTQNSQLSFGTAFIEIPYTHKAGRVESKPFWSMGSKYSPEKYIVLEKIEQTTQERFLQNIVRQVDGDQKNIVVVFVPGYHSTFETSAKRFSQVLYDLKLNAASGIVPILYSWPSQGAFSGYKLDEISVEKSTVHLHDFLLALAAKLDKIDIYVVAHSMGGRAVVSAFSKMSSIQGSLFSKFRRIVLIAPDVDQSLFLERLSAPLLSMQIPITLYASSKDEALKISQKEHGVPRLGEAGKNLMVLSGLETVDASDVHTDFTGHNYYTHGPVMADIAKILSGITDPLDRSGLASLEAKIGTYWKFK